LFPTTGARHTCILQLRHSYTASGAVAAFSLATNSGDFDSPTCSVTMVLLEHLIRFTVALVCYASGSHGSPNGVTSRTNTFTYPPRLNLDLRCPVVQCRCVMAWLNSCFDARADTGLVGCRPERGYRALARSAIETCADRTGATPTPRPGARARNRGRSPISLMFSASDAPM
jgi:hypothetical protein